MLQTKPVGERVTVVIAGELDHCAAPQIRRMLDDLLTDEAVTHLVLDLENLTFMDSSGIGVPPVEKLFRLSGLHRVIGIESKKGGRL